MRRHIIPYSRHLKLLARELRNDCTKTEYILWQYLKGRFEGKYDFHRQKPLGNFIADFFCYELKLVIELDGGYHNEVAVQEKDLKKECCLNNYGLNVMRFKNEEIYEDLEGCLTLLRNYIVAFESDDYNSHTELLLRLNILSKAEPFLNDLGK